MRKKWTLAAAVAGVCAALAVPAGTRVGRRTGESAQAGHQRPAEPGLHGQHRPNRLRADERMRRDQCQEPQAGHPVGALHRSGRQQRHDRALVLDVVSQSISVTLDCNAADAPTTRRRRRPGRGRYRPGLRIARPTPAQGLAPAPVLSARGGVVVVDHRQLVERVVAAQHGVDLVACRWSWSTTRPIPWRRRCRRSL